MAEKNELVAEEAEFLKQAVFCYSLDILDKSVPVYSATNPGSSRFDIVRVIHSAATRFPRNHHFIQGSESHLMRHLLRQIRAARPDELSVVRIRLDGRDQCVDLRDPQASEAFMADLEQRIEEEEDTESDDDEEDEACEFTPSHRVLFSGVPTTEFSWFPGYVWAHAICPTCQDQIGWGFFKNGKLAFLALIVTKLREEVAN